MFEAGYLCSPYIWANLIFDTSARYQSNYGHIHACDCQLRYHVGLKESDHYGLRAAILVYLAAARLFSKVSTIAKLLNQAVVQSWDICGRLTRWWWCKEVCIGDVYHGCCFQCSEGLSESLTSLCARKDVTLVSQSHVWSLLYLFCW